MTVHLFKMLDDTDVIAEIVPQQNKAAETMKLKYPMIIVTSDYDGHPLIALKMLNFYGSATEIDIPVSSILYKTTARPALEKFYVHTVQSYYEQFDLQINSMLERVYKLYLEETKTQSEEQQFLSILKRMSNSANTTFQ